MDEKELIGVVTHYFDKLGVCIIKLEKDIKIGDKIEFAVQEPFIQEVTSMQVEHKNVNEAKAGQEIGLKSDKQVHENNKVYRA
ncbi:hypothetical protein HN695_04745 [Candidatus Woesearchaeota archaeon]|nr:hypothetical protein [Candidatus Woesearchaeota archaeon]MBT5272031.1 hypothetical protein [Candidatus Woesearchaeota archaeon]MBT6040772.1 hypothetical protein [Candidatus Woesearchaeota archaeon]MBT6336844.1 hypothetical protein [Candidatus Woesearchaeota archaeon]MBT7927621.1 hypothetical protein [Candidatus Woesearchaeota archaeon]